MIPCHTPTITTMYPQRRSIVALAVDLALCALWGWFAYGVIRGWLDIGKPVKFGLFMVNTTFAYLFVARRPSKECSVLPKDWIVTVLTILLSFALAGFEGRGAALSHVSVAVQCVSVAMLFVAVCSLGRSFGLVPANRGVKVAGMYAYVRHPLYACELLFYTAFVLGHFCAVSALVLVGIGIGLHLRAGAEERLLSNDPQYRAYLEAVPYRFVPWGL